MKDFVFHNPTKIIFGDGTVSQVGAEAASYGKRALLVYGMGSVKKNGVYDQVVASLTEAGVEIVEYPGVKSNPMLSYARQGVELAKKEKVDVVVAVGGGSVIDTSKSICAGAVTDTDILEFFVFTSTVETALPLLTVLTIPAAGSEMNGGMVLTNDETLDKLGTCNYAPLYPKVSILDPTVTYTIPADYTAFSAADAMSHLLEGYWTHEDEWTPIQDRYVEGLCKSIMEAGEKAVADPSDYQGRATLMWAATMAFNDLSSSGVGAIYFPCHMLEHPLSAIYDISHGAGLSITMLAWTTYAAENRNTARIAQLARNVFGATADDDLAAAKDGIETFRQWLKKIGSYTCFADAGIPESDIDKITERTAFLADLWGITEHGYNAESISEIYRMCGPFKDE
ncbi:MAG: iron-containing alcohol dehydrogenase [Planctomycetes bacterium]|nr:iron-containing alcohol dehydrogenase [Planctomycetota bacterium]